MNVQLKSGTLSVLDQGKGPAVLLLHAFPLHHAMWEPQLAILSSRFRVIAPDIRGFGESRPSSPWTMEEMADDLNQLLDLLKIESCTVAGVSMGGYIAQTMAIEHPHRIRSLTSMMSTTGALSVGQPTPQTLTAVFSGPPATTRQEIVDRKVRAVRAVRSPGFELDEAGVRDRAGRAYDRADDPLGVARTALASIASGDRTPRLHLVGAPTLVIHGDSDAMCDVSGGRATAAAIPGAELVIIHGLGHDLPRELWPEIASRIATLVQRAEALTARN